MESYESARSLSFTTKPSTAAGIFIAAATQSSAEPKLKSEPIRCTEQLSAAANTRIDAPVSGRLSTVAITSAAATASTANAATSTNFIPSTAIANTVSIAAGAKPKLKSESKLKLKPSAVFQSSTQ